MHFWNKLSTAALMRLTILASLNLIMGRMVGSWMVVLHPLFFLSMVTIDLGLYALLVYSGTLNGTLIGMMLAGLAGVLLAIAFGGTGPDTFGTSGPWADVTGLVDSMILTMRELLSLEVDRSTPFAMRWRPWIRVIMWAYIIVDVLGLILIAAGGLLARALQARSGRRDTPASPPSS